jgi:hypothetical protein
MLYPKVPSSKDKVPEAEPFSTEPLTSSPGAAASVLFNPASFSLSEELSDCSEFAPSVCLSRLQDVKAVDAAKRTQTTHNFYSNFVFIKTFRFYLGTKVNKKPSAQDMQTV